MTLIAVLFAVGLLLLALELVLPGAVAGVIGGVLMLAGVGLVYSDYGAMYGTLSLLGAALAVVTCVVVEIWWLPRSKFAGQLILKDTAGVTPQPPASRDVIGKRGRTLTMLAPTGYVEIDGRTYEAMSVAGLLAKGETVVVESLDQFKLTVNRSSS